MLKTIFNMLVGALITGAVSFAYAVVGTPPTAGPQLVDGTWLIGLAGGQNATFQSGITAAGTTQATAFTLPVGIQLFSIDTVAASTGVALPPCLGGTIVQIYNNGASTLTIYPSITNNPVTAAQDTIDNATTATALTHTSKDLFCAKNGVWAAQ